MDSFWDFFWLLVWTFFFVFYLMVLFQIVGDLFRDKDLSGWWKALWVIFLIIFPFLAALIYLIARGKGMAERHAVAAQSAQAATDQYIKSVASQGSSPADQIASAKSLLDSGAITQQEFDQLKQKALAS
jgi:ABC-type multidrug transport system fused ATPase/permease subunit